MRGRVAFEVQLSPLMAARQLHSGQAGRSSIQSLLTIDNIINAVTETVGKVHLLAPGGPHPSGVNGSMKECICPNIRKTDQII